MGRVEWARALRTKAMAIFLFLGGGGSAIGAANSFTHNEDTNALIEAIVALVGIIGSLLTLLSALLGKREKLVRGDLGIEVNSLIKTVSAHGDRLDADDRWFEEHDRRVERLLHQQHENRMSQQDQIQGVADSVNILMGELKRFGEETREQGKLTMELINLLRQKIEAK